MRNADVSDYTSICLFLRAKAACVVSNLCRFVFLGRSWEHGFGIESMSLAVSALAGVLRSVCCLGRGFLPNDGCGSKCLGLELGESRVITGFHYASDVEYGRISASVAFAKLVSDPEYVKLMKLARRELEALRRGAGQKDASFDIH